MLLLSCRVGEKIVIGTATANVTITALALKGNAVRLGITAPPHIRIRRQEVADRVTEEIRELSTRPYPGDPAPPAAPPA